MHFNLSTSQVCVVIYSVRDVSAQLCMCVYRLSITVVVFTVTISVCTNSETDLCICASVCVLNGHFHGYIIYC